MNRKPNLRNRNAQMNNNISTSKQKRKTVIDMLDEAGACRLKLKLAQAACCILL
jgi:hypothetical protein